MTSDDTPLVIERDNELPAKDKHRIIIIGYVQFRESSAWRGRLTSTVHPQHATFSTVPLPKEVSWIPEPMYFAAKGVRTTIHHLHIGIMIMINHLGGNLMGWKVGGWV